MAKEIPTQHAKEHSSGKTIQEDKEDKHTIHKEDKDTDAINANMDQLISQKSLEEEKEPTVGRIKDHTTKQQQ